MDIELACSGDVDLARRDALLDETRTALDTAGVTRLVIDLAEVTFMDSTGLSVLLDTRNHAPDLDIEIELRAPSPSVMHVLKLGGMLDLFTITT